MDVTRPMTFAAPTAAKLHALRAALDQVRPGYALPQAFYRDATIFEQDMEHFVMAHWHCAGHTSLIRNAGEYFTVSLANESVIVVRGEDGEIRAFANVCRHRGSRICTESEGRARNGLLVCPYHAWAYDLKGHLQNARLTPDEFGREDYGLRPVALRVCEGVVFISFARQPLGFDHVEASFGHAARIYGWAEAKIAARRMYLLNANWKLVVENYQECYHCGPAHQEYSRRHIFSRPPAQREGADRAMAERDRALGIELTEVDHFAQDADPQQEGADCCRSALSEGYLSGSRNGKPLAPLMGAFKGKAHDGGFSFLDVGPTSNFVAYPDYGLIYRTIPQSVDRTAYELIWLVDGDAVEGRDYEEKDLVWMWEHTSDEDKKIIELNQAGVNSRFFEPGPYTPMEADTARYIDWYTAVMRQAVAVDPESSRQP